MIRRIVSPCLLAAAVLVIAHPASAQHSVATNDHDATAARRMTELLARPVTINVRDLSLRQMLDTIAATAKVPVQYHTQVIDAYHRRVTLRLAGAPLSAVLDRVLVGTTLRVVPDGAAQLSIVDGGEGMVVNVTSGTIVGSVTDEHTRRPLAGVSVSLDDASHGVLTGDDGSFRLSNVSSGAHRVTAKVLGYVRQVATVEVGDGGTATTNFALVRSTNVLSQVVVTGMVVPTELKAVPNAMTVITAKQLEERGITHIDQLFRGDVPGVFAMNGVYNAFLGEVTMFSRGATALPSGGSAGVSPITGTTNTIKTYVDGIELADPQYLSQIDPKSIERIEILTGPQASTIYGSNAVNGVMNIFTKRGTSNTPQLTLNLLSGWVQNNFGSALAPQHDYSAQLSGVEGRLSYNAGGSWNYIGPWSPAAQTTRTSGFGGVRLALSTPIGSITTDVTLRRATTQNKEHGSNFQGYFNYLATGLFFSRACKGCIAPTIDVLNGETIGLTVLYTPTHWLSHEIGVGRDVEATEHRSSAQEFGSPEDTGFQFSQAQTERRSLEYKGTAHVSATSMAQATVTVGADAWQKISTSLSTSPVALTGTLGDVCASAYGFSCTSIQRQPDHNAGGFLQTQLAVDDRLFLTYGLRAEWNPSFGKEIRPNYAPRYGIAYTTDLGAVTMKARASYGRSTRPPQIAEKNEVGACADGCSTMTLNYYGNFASQFANPDLLPESQRGGEGGVELYFGTRASLVVTRYNQTFNDMLAFPKVDSVRSFTSCVPANLCNYDNVDTAGYGYRYQYQWLNIGSIRNQGWELQGSVTTGPFTTKGTYSWTKSRTIGITPKYRAQFPANAYPQYQPGATFRYLPEHTWAFGTIYTRSQTMVNLSITGVGQLLSQEGDLLTRHLASDIRLLQEKYRMSASGAKLLFNRGYAMADVTASHQFLSSIDGLLQVQNLTDRYVNDFGAFYPTIGRQMKVGARVHVQ